MRAVVTGCRWKSGDEDGCSAVQAGILTVEGCLGDEGQESESGELCLGTGADSYR